MVFSRWLIRGYIPKKQLTPLRTPLISVVWKEIVHHLHAMTIIHMVNIFSLSVSDATLPKPTLVMHDMVKYSAVTYMVFLEGPFISSVELVISLTLYEYGY